MGLTDFLTKRQQQQQSEQQSLTAAYRDLLRRHADWTAADEKRMAEIVDALNIDTDKLKADAEIIAEVSALTPHADAEAERRKVEFASRQAVAAHVKLMQETTAKLESEIETLDAIQRKAAGQVGESIQARERLAKLKQQHPHLLG